MKLESGISVNRGSFDDFLREIPMFARLEPRALAQVQLIAEPFQVSAGTTLFRQGDEPDGLYLIKHGEIEILRRLPGDEAVRLATLGRSAVVGEMSLLDHNPRSTNALAITSTSGYFISSERFQTLQSDFSPPAFAVMDCFRHEVVRRARTVIDQIAELVAPAQAGMAVRDAAAVWPAPTSTSTVEQRVLQVLPFFRTFRRSDLRELVAPLQRFDFARGQPVFAAGDGPRSCLLIVRGALSMTLPAAVGGTTFSVRGPGQMMGELALIDGAPQPLDCWVREPAIAFELDRARFEQLRKGGSVMALRFFDAVTSSIVAILRKANAHLARLTAERTSTPAIGAAAPAVAELS
jgi:CRP-like cAMP-binding protein